MPKNNTTTLGVRIVKVVLVIGVILTSVYIKAPNEISTSTPTVITAETLNEILKRGATISSIKFDIVSTSEIPEVPPTIQKVWIKKNKMRIEMTTEGRTIVYLIDMDAKTMYEHIPEYKVATKKAFPTDAQLNVDFRVRPLIKGFEMHKPVIVGTETINGKTCIVVEDTVEGTKSKSWIWKDKGLPIRMEMTIPFLGKITMEYKNIEFVDIPDSMFELPAGVQISKKTTGFGCIPAKDACHSVGEIIK